MERRKVLSDLKKMELNFPAGFEDSYKQEVKGFIILFYLGFFANFYIYLLPYSSISSERFQLNYLNQG